MKREPACYYELPYLLGAAAPRATLQLLIGTVTVYVPQLVIAPLYKCRGIPLSPKCSFGRSRRFTSTVLPLVSEIDVL